MTAKKPAKKPTTEADLLAAVYAAPFDDRPREAYATWLVERDDPRGEFIATQCALLRAGIRTLDDLVYADVATDELDRLAQLSRRAAELQEKHGSKWQREVLGKVDATVQFVRGMPSAIEVVLDRATVGKLKKLDLAIVRDLTLRFDDLETKAIADLIATMPRLRKLVVNGTFDVRALPPLDHLVELQLFSTGLDRDDLAHLGETALAKRLELLDLTYERTLADGALDALDGRFPRLREVSLQGAGITAKQLADEKRALRFPATVSFYGNEDIGPQGAATLAQRSWLADTTTLGLQNCKIGDTGLAAFAKSKHVKKLTALQLNDNNLSDTGLASLARAKLPLAKLAFEDRRISPAGIEKVLKAHALRALEIHPKSGTDSDRYAAVIGRHGESLRALDVYSGVLSDKGATSLAALTELRSLVVKSRVTDKGANALVALHCLVRFWMSQNELTHAGQDALLALPWLVEKNVGERLEPAKAKPKPKKR